MKYHFIISRAFVLLSSKTQCTISAYTTKVEYIILIDILQKRV